MNRPFVSVAAILLFVTPSLVRAQGLLVVEDPSQQVRLPRPIIIWPPYPHPLPRPVPPPIPISYKLKELGVEARLIDQVARVQVSQTFVNTGSRPMEVAFVFPLPYDGAIEQMTLLIDGREYPAKLLDAKEARRMYEEIVRKNRDPALLEWLGTGLFRTNVFPVPAGASRTVTLRYSQLCRKQEGLTDFLFPLSTAKYTSEAVEKVEIRATIESQEEIKNVYSPSHNVEIKRPDERRAVVTFTSKNEVPGSDFRLLYDVGKGKVGARVLSYRPERSQDGFFLLLASPEIKPSAPSQPKKTVLLVIDRSGSMSGKKIEQVRAALTHILNNLRPGDLFNIVAYDSQVELFRPELQRFDDQTHSAALGFVEGLYAGGTTNIDAAMHTALGQLQDPPEKGGQAPFVRSTLRAVPANGACPPFSGPRYVIFLTDGLPTAGETNEMKIVANAKQLNKIHARVFTFGVGYDVNSRLLDNRLYPKDSFDLFAGEQLVVVGRYRRPGTAKVIVQGSVGESREKFDFPATLVEKSNDEGLAFIEKLWATRRVGEILDELDLRGKNDELVKELVDLATRHGILTPYTSFMADEGVSIHDMAGNMARADRRLAALDQSSGAGGFVQRELKGSFQRAASAPAAMSAGSLAEFAPGRAGAELSFGAEASHEAQVAVQNVPNIGNRTFFRRDGQWVDSQMTKEQESQARCIKQFSDEYFELARSHSRRLSQYLVFDEPVLLNLDNQAYLIEP